MASFGSATLVLNGPDGGIPIHIPKHRVAIGRVSPGNDIVIVHHSVASRHCEFDTEEGELILRDLGSLQGTYINGHRVHAVRVYDGDHIQIGDAEGLLEVRRNNGQPLLPPGQRKHLPIAASLLALVVLTASVIGFALIRERFRERESFLEYEARAQVFLSVPTPCALARDEMQQLTEEEEKLGKLGLSGRRSRTLDSEQLRTLLTVSLPREEQLRVLLASLDTGIDRPLHESFEILRSYEGRFRGRRLSETVKSLHQNFQDQIAAHERFRAGLQHYREQVVLLNAHLHRLAESNIQTASDSLPVSANPLRVMELQNQCESTFSQLSTQGMMTLASAPL